MRGSSRDGSRQTQNRLNTKDTTVDEGNRGKSLRDTSCPWWFMVYVVSGALLFGYSGQLPHYLLEACATRLVGTGGYGAGSSCAA